MPDLIERQTSYVIYALYKHSVIGTTFHLNAKHPEQRPAKQQSRPVFFPFREERKVYIEEKV